MLARASRAVGSRAAARATPRAPRASRSYHAPVRDMRFLLHEVLRISEHHATLQHTAECDRDTVQLKADFFDVAKFPTAKFVSTSVKAEGTGATITGNLTIKGITKPVTLDAEFYGAGTNPMNKQENVGFVATGSIKRSDFGLGYAVPVVGDAVELKIIAGFQK